MNKSSLAVALLGAALALSSVMTLAHYATRPVKHTGPAALAYIRADKHNCYWFSRPNAEVFEMCFDNPPPFNLNMKFYDIAYKDDNKDLRHFLSAVVIPDGAK